jgi:hypothetical protein
MPYGDEDYARRPYGVSNLFGNTIVYVEVDDSALAWVIKNSEGAVVMNVPWRWAYDQRDIGDRRWANSSRREGEGYAIHSRWMAFEVAVHTNPLTPERTALLESRFPGMTSNPLFVVHNPPWPTPLQAARSRAPSALIPREVRNMVTVPENRDVLDILDQPTEVPETAPEPGERKLLL